MTAPLLSIDDVAETFGISTDQAKRLARSDDWPHIRLSAKVIRFEPEQVDAIVAMYRKRGDLRVGLPGQTSASRRRAS